MIDTNSLKEQIRQRTDLVELVSEHVALRASGRDFVGLCPFHNEKTPSFTVSPEKQIFKCFGCGAGGDVFTFVQLRESTSFPEAVRTLADRAGIDYDRMVGQGPSSGINRADIARVNGWAANQFSQAFSDSSDGRVARAYVSERKISDEMVARFGIGWAPDDSQWLQNRARESGIGEDLLLASGLIQAGQRGDKYSVFRGRLMFPIRDTMNRVIGFGGRTLKGDKAKYLNTSQNVLFDKGNNLYGVDLARLPMGEKRSAVVVEGYTDCIAAHQFGFKNVVATLGTALTDNQVNLLRRWNDEIILVFDSDNAGMNAADRAIGVALRYNLAVKIAHVTEGKDPSDFLHAKGSGEFDLVLKSAIDALVFKWDRTLEKFSSTVGSTRKEAIREFVSVVAEMTRFQTVDAIQRGLVVNQLSKLLALPADDVHRMLAERTRAKVAGGERNRINLSQSGEPIARAENFGERSGGRVDAEQTALLTILKVLINEPGYFSDVEEVFRPVRIADSRARSVAERVVALCESIGEFTVQELLGGVENPHDAAFVADLVYQGTQLGNFDVTIADTCNRLKGIEVLRQGKEAAQQLRMAASQGSTETDAQEIEALRRIQSSLTGSHGFAPGIPASRWTGMSE